MTRQRLTSIDMLRGLVMVIMALDHVRDMLSPQNVPSDFGDADAPLFLTRWITHLCAPTFILLAGTSAFLYGAGGRSKTEVSRFLFTRGLWLVVIELTVVNFGVNFNFGPQYVPFVQVIWAIGMSMIVLSILVWIPRSLIAGIALSMIFGHNLLVAIQPAASETSAVWVILHQGGPIRFANGLGVYVAYPLVPWIGVMALGYVIGPLFANADPTRPRRLVQAGLVMIVAFFVLRFWSLYGEPNGWLPHETFAATMVDFLHTTKYPPSLHFLLMTLGPALLILGSFERCSGRWTESLVIIGRVPFFFYVVHIYLIHALALAVGYGQGFALSEIAVAFFKLPKAFGVGLGGVYLFWIAVVLMLYPACRWFAGVKQRRRDWWLSYL